MDMSTRFVGESLRFGSVEQYVFPDGKHDWKDEAGDYVYD